MVQNKYALTDTPGTAIFVKISHLNGGESFRSKMIGQGLFPGQVAQIVSSQKNGPVVVKVNNSRIIIGSGMAEKIIVSIL